MKLSNLDSSYRDPSGFVFTFQKKIFRQINYSYRENYDLLMQSGLYQKLVDEELLLPHKEISGSMFDKKAYKIISPKHIPFISYPYEWCFSQLKDAALLTLKIQKKSLDFGMNLKDASSFNIQFLAGKPILIDTLSFEKYEEGKPWTAYKQFCEHFLAPLSLAAFCDIRLIKLFETNLNGIPLDLCARLLPFRSRLKLSLFLNIFLHARSYKNLDKKSVNQKNQKSFKKNSLLGLIQNLEDGIKTLKLKHDETLWSSYYKDEKCLSYDEKALDEKSIIVGKYLACVNSKTLWDIGANNGLFSRIADKMGIFTVSMDSDPYVVEQNYLEIKNKDEKNILPLWIDIVNPTPSLGWENKERDSLFSRPLPDTILALALVHHLAIGNNLPISRISSLFANSCKNLIVEFVPKNDPKVQLLLKNRTDIFDDYKEDDFEQEFSKFFSIKKKTKIKGTERILYLMMKKT